MMGKAKAQQKLIDNLEEEFLKVSFPLVNFLGMISQLCIYFKIIGFSS